ncbi:hypothetical protein [Clostridium sp. HBUAS56010]|uniref:hypothetical protein n=1 Tax=Clostridium sp. HBUAS56010 TaxID=2571127 RepID=UPI00163D929A|nr:hypothetical protein [Clostridium sp. HBUAS56010]
MFLKQSIISDAVLNNEGLKIVYDDVAPYAKENSNPQVVEPGLKPRVGLHPQKGLFPKATTIRKEFPDLKRDDLVYPGYALCLPGFALLNGEYVNFPDGPADYGFISDEVSDSNGDFKYSSHQEGLKPREGLHPQMFLFPRSTNETYVDAPVLTITFNQKFTSVGLLLTFNTMSGDYANHINVKWYADNDLISNMDYEPNGTEYFCSNYVMYYDKIIITFLSTSKPYRPVFLTRIDYGIYREFLSDEVKEISCLQEINAISENISINTMNFTVRTKSNIAFDLQKKQKLSLYFNGGLIGNFYLKNGARKSKTDYYMDAHDALGILDGNEYHGGIYTGQLVPDVIADIFSDEDFNYMLSDAFDNVQLHGYIPYTTKRNALVQIAFAIGAVVDTSNYDGVVIYPKQGEKTGEFTDGEVFSGLTLEHSDVVTGVRLTVHDYRQSEETAEIYKGNLSGTAQVIFKEAYHDLSITGGSINTSGDNYAYITGSGDEVILTGKKYNHYTSTVIKENPNITYNKNIKEVPDATLVYDGNAAEILERVYEYYQHAENVVCDVLLADKVIGQVVDINTDYDGVKTGTIESVSYSFAGSIKAEVTIHE